MRHGSVRHLESGGRRDRNHEDSDAERSAGIRIGLFPWNASRFAGQDRLHISGTASVDEKGDTVHLDDPRKQIERMLLNVQELLKPHGATMQDLTQAATFLKHKEYLEMYEEILEEWGVRNVPNTLVEAGVCRPNLLCEMEAVAVLPKRTVNGERVAVHD